MNDANLKCVYSRVFQGFIGTSNGHQKLNLETQSANRKFQCSKNEVSLNEICIMKDKNEHFACNLF